MTENESKDDAVERLMAERDLAIRMRDAAREASARDMEQRRAFAAQVRKLEAELSNVRDDANRIVAAVVKQSDHNSRRAAFYKCCALSGEVPSLKTIEEVDSL